MTLLWELRLREGTPSIPVKPAVLTGFVNKMVVFAGLWDIELAEPVGQGLGINDPPAGRIMNTFGRWSLSEAATRATAMGYACPNLFNWALHQVKKDYPNSPNLHIDLEDEDFAGILKTRSQPNTWITRRGFWGFYQHSGNDPQPGWKPGGHGNEGTSATGAAGQTDRPSFSGEYLCQFCFHGWLIHQHDLIPSFLFPSTWPWQLVAFVGGVFLTAIMVRLVMVPQAYCAACCQERLGLF